MKLLFVLRNPLERAWSQYCLFRRSYLAGLPFAVALRKAPYLIERGRYGEQLQTLHKLFPSEAILVRFYEDIEAEPASFMQSIYSFLGVDAHHEPAALNRRYNRVMYERTQQALARVHLRWLVAAVKVTPLGDWLRRRHSQSHPPGFTRRDFEYVFDRLRRDYETVEELTGRDLRRWRTFPT